MGKIKATAIVFDQGNTLIMDPFQAVLGLKVKEFGNLLAGYGVSVDAQGMVREWTRANKKVHYPYIGHFFQEEPIVQEALRGLGLAPEVAAPLGLELLREYRAGLKEWIASDPRTQQVKETLAELRNRKKRLGVFSNDRAVNLGVVLCWMGIQPYFEYVETSESVGMEKPDPRVFEGMLDHFQLPAHMVAYVGDDPVRDVDAAKKKDLRAVLYLVDPGSYNEHWRDYSAPVKSEPDAVVRSFAELLEIFE
jgi:HAD superfamily hydrolase (TIGR01549 family)